MSTGKDRPLFDPFFRLNCKSFPYYIAYVVKDAEIFIVAIANANRQPEYWIKRTRN